MSGFAQFIHELDLRSFFSLQDLFQSPFSDEWMIYVASPWFWAPLMAFALVVLVGSKRGAEWLNAGFFVGTFVLTYQAGSLLAHMFGRPAPFRGMPDFFLLRPVPEITFSNEYSLPDWGMAALIAVMMFSSLRVHEARRHFPIVAWSLLIVPVIARVYAGYAYPLDVVMGLLLGMLVGNFMFHFARNLEIAVR